MNETKKRGEDGTTRTTETVTRYTRVLRLHFIRNHFNDSFVFRQLHNVNRHWIRVSHGNV